MKIELWYFLLSMKYQYIQNKTRRFSKYSEHFTYIKIPTLINNIRIFIELII